MKIIGVDLGGTKCVSALFDLNGKIHDKVRSTIAGREGAETGSHLISQVKKLLSGNRDVLSIGISVPGIYNPVKKTVWAPNIPGWEAYPLMDEVQAQLNEKIPVQIDSDRSCSILGEVWKGNARGCKHAIFIAVGTGIGAGILVNGEVLRGAGNIAGAVGWMALGRPLLTEYSRFGCFEYHASGDGLVRIFKKYLAEEPEYQGLLKSVSDRNITAKDIFEAYKKNDGLAVRVIREAVEYWGMATANFVSVFNPEKIIFGGGVFDSAAPLIGEIVNEAKKWAQPISMNEVSVEQAGLGSEAAIYGAAYLGYSSHHTGLEP